MYIVEEGEGEGGEEEDDDMDAADDMLVQPQLESGRSRLTKDVLRRLTFSKA